ncbi:MAG: GldG family protein [Bacteriovoracaceae bacterium]|nr:GldG family protein [Bacteriovoracaceae bacterium]
MTSGLKWLAYIVNVILYLVVVALWISIPDEFVLCLSVTAVTLVMTTVLLIWDRDKLSEIYESSQFINFSQAFVAAFLLFSILGMLNYFSYKHPIQWDLTSSSHYSLTDQTQKVMNNAKEELTFKIFAKKMEFNSIQALTDLYYFHKSNIKREYIDIETRPDLVSANNVLKSPTIIVEYAGKREHVTVLNELNLTNAIKKLSLGKMPTLVFTTGHGEAGLESKENEGLSYLAGMLKNSNYNIAQVNTAVVSYIPTSAEALIIWGPKEAFRDKEVKIIDTFIERGGNLVVAFDPNLNGEKFSNLKAILHKRGIDVSNDLVIDRLKHINGSNGTVPMVDRFNSESPIVKDFKGPVFFPLVSSIKKVPGSKGEFTSLVKSMPFPASWAEKTGSEVVEGNVLYTEGVDDKGPSTMAATWEDKKSRISVFGNSTFLINTYKKFGQNFVFFTNAMNWTIEQDVLISFNLPVVKEEPVFISKPQLGIIFYFSVIVAPLLLFATAFTFYRRLAVL